METKVKDQLDKIARKPRRQDCDKERTWGTERLRHIETTETMNPRLREYEDHD